MGLAGSTILVVDDNDDIRDLITFILEDNAFTVVAASDGDTALALVESAKPDLILLDVMMPGLSGIQTLERIRRSSNLAAAATPVLMITAKSQSEDIEVALKAGASSYIVKPFQSAALLEKVSNFLTKESAI